jgi:hypothetical protein
MSLDLVFEHYESRTFTSRFLWRLEGKQIRFRGENGVGQPFPPLEPIPVDNKQIVKFVAALDLLDVWSWKPNYDPSECGYSVCDGMSWSFKASIGDRGCSAGGDNAYPSFADHQKASLDSERYALLVVAADQYSG